MEEEKEEVNTMGIDDLPVFDWDAYGSQKGARAIELAEITTRVIIGSARTPSETVIHRQVGYVFGMIETPPGEKYIVFLPRVIGSIDESVAHMQVGEIISTIPRAMIRSYDMLRNYR